MVDRVQPLVWESTDDGGSSDETYHKEIDKNEDALDARGLYVQNDTSSNEDVLVSRDASDNMTFKDGVVSGTKTLTELLSGNSSDITKEPTGFTEPENTIVTYNSGTRTVTLTGTVNAYWKGVEITALVTSWESAAHPAAPTSGQFLYYNGTSFVWSTSSWLFSDLPIAYVAFASDGTFLFALREVHGTMPWPTHEDLHNNIGTYRKSGADVTAFVTESTTAVDRRPQVSECVLGDEDLPSTLVAHTTQNNYSRAHLTGAGGVPVITTGEADIPWLSGGAAQWNEFTGGVWTNTQLANNSYMSLWLMAVPASADSGSQLARFIWWAGQSVSGSGDLASEQAKTPNELNLGEFATTSPEFVFLEQVIIQETGVNDWKVIEQRRLTGNRVSFVSSGGGGVTDHGALTGLTDYDHPQYFKRPEYTIMVSKTGTDTGGDFSTVQGAIDSVTPSFGEKYIVQIYPGDYAENVTLKNGISLKGMGQSGDVIISATTGDVLTSGTFPSLSQVENITIKCNPDGINTARAIVSKGIFFELHHVTIDVDINDGYMDCISLESGTTSFIACSFFYNQTGTGGGNHTYIRNTSTSAFVVQGGYIQMDVAAIDQTDYVLFVEDDGTSTGTKIVQNSLVSMIASTASFDGNAEFWKNLGDTTNNNTNGCDIQISTPSGTANSLGTAYDVAGTSGTIHSSNNRINITGFFVNYMGEVDSGNTLISHFDDSVTADGVTGAGDFYAVYSTENGELRVSDSLKVGNVPAGNYIDIDAGGEITLHGTAKAEKHLHLPVNVFGGGTTAKGTVVDHPALFFDDTVDEYRSFSFDIPDDIDLSVDPKIRLYIVPRSTQSTGSDFVMRVTDMRYVSIGEGLDKTPDETNLDATLTVSNTRRIAAYAEITLDGSLMASAEGLSGRVYRLATDIGDDRNGDACIIALNFVYTTNKVN